MQVEPEEDPNEPWFATGGRRGIGRRTTIDRENQGERTRVNNNDPLFTGEMIPVDSSNVHSIGFLLEGVEQGQPSQGAILHTLKGTLLVRYLATRGDGIRSGPGPLYEYQDVPATLFMDFQRASSKGIWVWDHLRVRGTVAGHRYAYNFAGSEDSNIPRQAALRRGQTGQHFIRRTFLGHQSQLADRRVTNAGPNPERGSTRGGVRGQNEGTNRGGVGGLRFVRGSGRSR